MNDIRKHPGELFHPLTYAVPFEVYELHTHVFWEFTIILKGKAISYINNKQYNVVKCDLTISKPKDIHKFKVLTPNEYEHRDIYLNDEVMKNICETLQPNLYDFLISSTDLEIIHLSEDIILNLDKRLRQLQLADANNISTEEYAVQRSLIAYLLGIFIENDFSKKQPYPKWITDFLTVMNSSEIICGTLENAMAEINYSHEHISRQFKHYIGISPIDYFNQKKMEFALALITNTDSSILEISSLIGYDSLSHFIHKFKKAYGIAPGQYRKSFLNK